MARLMAVLGKKREGERGEGGRGGRWPDIPTKPDVTAELRRRAAVTYALRAGQRDVHGVGAHVRCSEHMFWREDAQRENRPTCNWLVCKVSG